MALRRTLPRLVFEQHKINGFLQHPYTRQTTKDWMWLPPFHWRGCGLACVLSAMYIFYDYQYGFTARQSHPHNRFAYGCFGEKIYVPNSGTSFAYNWPALSKVGTAETFGGKHEVPLSISSPFAEDRIKNMGHPRNGGGHH
eukprot:TRINITY_DN1251_c0_g1_i1.p1 TRINITY_DN1251_c0_g1~~TRINITY_DN1251_c0_g1_i1.p1  ORF type:complete len:155 (+),score=7.43 TRINITY_DN1251_c0_g1_i1:45-467(+)